MFICSFNVSKPCLQLAFSVALIVSPIPNLTVKNIFHNLVFFLIQWQCRILDVAARTAFVMGVCCVYMK
jgi:hypothetical protein